MKIVFIDQLGCYASLVAAVATSCREEVKKKRLSWRDIAGLPGFACHRDLKPGILRSYGSDSGGNELFTLGVGKEANLLIVSAADLFKILGSHEKVRILDMSPINSPWIVLLSFLGVTPLKKITRLLAAFLLCRRLPQLTGLLEAGLGKELDAQQGIKDNEW